MFLFILSGNSLNTLFVDSNTSHVLIYLYADVDGGTAIVIQIHLMFLFIWFADRFNEAYANDSNTSHVLIYPGLSL